MARLNYYGKHRDMIEIEMLLTSKSCPWSSKILSSMVLSNEIVSRHETDVVEWDEQTVLPRLVLAT